MRIIPHYSIYLSFCNLFISRTFWLLGGCVVVGPETVRIYSSLPVRNLLPSDWTPRGTPRDGWWNNYGQGIPKYELELLTFDAELATKIPEVIYERRHL